MKEIFIDVTDDIVKNVNDYYMVSNTGKVINKITGKCIGSLSKRELRYKCSLILKSGKICFIDMAKLIYKSFNKNEDLSNKVIVFKDFDSYNIKLDNLYSIYSYELTAYTINRNLYLNRNLTNNQISRAKYHIKNKIIMFHNIDEIWVDITSNEVKDIKPYYMISNYGRVFNKAYNSMVYPQISYNGYMYFIASSITGKQLNVSIHRTMLKCFKPLNDYTNIECNHIDTNSLNNNLDNLEWLSSNDNESYIPECIINDGKKMCEEDVRKICELLELNKSYIEICFIIGCKYTGSMHKRLSDIHRRITYKDISKDYNF